MEDQELSWRERGRLWMRLGIRLLLTLLVLAALALAGPALLSLFMPFVLAFVVAWLLNPLVRGIQRRLGISRKFLSLVLILLILALAGGLLVAFIWNIAQEAISLYEDWSSISTALQEALFSLDHAFSRFMSLIPADIRSASDAYLESLFTWLQGAVTTALGNSAAYATRIAKQVPSFAVGTVVFLMGSYYLTADYPHIRYLVSKRFTGRSRHFLLEVRQAALSAFGGVCEGRVHPLGGGLFHPAGGLYHHRTALYAAAGLSSGHHGLHPHHRRGHRHGALGGGGPGPGEYPGIH